MSIEDPKFETRKKDHISQSLISSNQVGIAPSDEIQLYHKAMPEIDFADVSLQTTVLNNVKLAAPIFVSSMTAGHSEGEKINYKLAKACAEKNWLFAVGSQRKQLSNPEKDKEWTRIINEFPDLSLAGNLGVTQLITSGPDKMLKLIESLKANAIFIHCNPLQEVLQVEGTPRFKNGLKAIEEFCKLSPVPVLLKETGCGFDMLTLKRVFEISDLYGVDVSGFGGTHWGRIEGGRNETNNMATSKKRISGKTSLEQNIDLDMYIKASKTYANWGITTAKSLSYAAKLMKQTGRDGNYWASGGVRTGLDIVSCLSMGAEMVGLAQPILRHALEGYDILIQYMELLEFETKIGLFCSGYKDVGSCRKDAKWEWKI